MLQLRPVIILEVMFTIKILVHQGKLEFHSSYLLCLRWRKRNHKYVISKD